MATNLATVDLNLLVALDALLSERNVTRAAERLSVGQSAMSSTLARLRRLFDDPLLVREGRYLTPTPLAESLAEPIRQALDIVESTLALRSDFHPTTDPRTFTLSTSDYVTLVLVRPLIERLEAIAPHVRINIIPVSPGGYTDDLRRERADLLILPEELLPGEIPYPHRPILTDGYVVACDENHPELTEAITLEQLSTLPYVAYRSGTRASLVDQQLDRLHVSRNVEITSQSFLLAPLLLHRTRLIMLVHEQLGRLLAPLHGLRLLPAPVPLQPTRQVMLWNSRQTADAGHRWLREQLQVVAAEIASTPDH